MGRVKLQLKKIENKTYRHITFAKRKSGLVKKAYELSTLCDVEVALIIFSPAGKLFLFDGKKRIEEIFGRYIELPARRRGWVQNQELIRRIIAQMSLEAGLYNHPIISRTNSVDIDSQLQEIQKEILICRTQLEDVEKKLQYFLRSPNCVKSMTEAIYHEMILEETLKLVHFRKRILEANCVIQPTSQEFGVTFMPHLIDPRENPLHAQKASVEASMSRSLNYSLMNWQSQNHLQAPRNFTDQSIGVLHPSRNLAEPLVEKLPQPLSYLHGHRYVAGNEVNGQPNKSDGYIYRPTSGVVNANFPPRMHIIQQGRRATTSGAAQCEAGSSMGTFSGNTSNLDSDAWFRR